MAGGGYNETFLVCELGADELAVQAGDVRDGLALGADGFAGTGTASRGHPSVHRSRCTVVSSVPFCNGKPALSEESPDALLRKRKMPAFAGAVFPSVVNVNP